MLTPLFCQISDSLSAWGPIYLCITVRFGLHRQGVEQQQRQQQGTGCKAPGPKCESEGKGVKEDLGKGSRDRACAWCRCVFALTLNKVSSKGAGDTDARNVPGIFSRARMYP
jgi:hypothetical protein